jgi:hypothetical protein
MKITVSHADGKPVHLELELKELAQGARLKVMQALYQPQEKTNAQNDQNGKTPPRK